MPTVKDGKVFQDPCVSCPDAERCKLDYWKTEDRENCEYLEIDFDYYAERVQSIQNLIGRKVIRKEIDDKGNVYVVIKIEEIYYTGFKQYFESYYILKRCSFEIDLEYVNDLTETEFKTALISILTWNKGFKICSENGTMPSFRDYMNYQMLKEIKKVRRKKSYKTTAAKYRNEVHEGPQGLDLFK